MEISNIEKKIFNDLPIAIALFDIKDLSLFFINDSFKKLFGYHPKEITTFDIFCNKVFIDDEADVINNILKFDKNKRVVKYLIGTCKDLIKKYIKINLRVNLEKLYACFIDVSCLYDEFELFKIKDTTKTKDVLNENNFIKDIEERFEGICDNSLNSIIILKSSIIFSVNQSFLKLFKYSCEKEPIGADILDLIHPESRPIVRKSIQETEKGEVAQSEFEVKGIKRNGEIINLEINISSFILKDEMFNLIIIHDSQRENKQKQLILKNKELLKAKNILNAKYRILFENETDSIFFIKADKFIDCNNRALKMLSCEKEQLIGRTPDVISPKFQPNGILSSKLGPKFIQKAYEEKSQKFEWKHKCLDGRLLDTEVSLKLFEVNNEKLIQATVKELSENEVLPDEEFFHEFADFATEGIGICKDDTFIKVNKSMERIFGYSNKELIGKKISDLILKREYYPERFENFGKNYVEPYEAIGIRKDYNIFPLGIESKEILWKNKKVRLVSFSDNTEKKFIDKILVEHKKKFLRFFQKSHTILVLAEYPSLKFVEVNNKFVEELELSKEFVIGKTPVELGFIKREPLKKLMNDFHERGVYDFESKYITKSGKELITLNSIELIKFDNKEYLILSCLDISYQKMTKKELLKSIIHAEEKERQRYARELHDGLGPILSTQKLYLQCLDEIKDLNKRESIIEKGIENINEAIITLREISNNLDPYILKDYGLIKATQKFIDKIAERGLIEFDYQTGYIVERFSSEIEIMIYRTITELINNTLKYGEANMIRIRLSKDVHNFLLLNYSDNGKGFDKKEVENKNQGLGLSNIKNRISVFGGDVSICTEPQKGFSIEIKLNLSDS